MDSTVIMGHTKEGVSDAKVAPIHLGEPDLALCRANLGIVALVPCLIYRLDKLCMV